MRIELDGPERVAAGQEFSTRAILVNDSYEPVEIWRHAFVGPTVSPAAGRPAPPSVEATYGQPDTPITLQPFTFYGRDRRAGGFGPGIVVVTATYRPQGGEPLAMSRRIMIG